MKVRVQTIDDVSGEMATRDVEVDGLTAELIGAAILAEGVPDEHPPVTFIVLGQGQRDSSGGIWGVIRLNDDEGTICSFLVYTNFVD